MRTDYRTWAIVYSCQAIEDNKKIEDVWVLSRRKTLGAADFDAAQAIISDEVPDYDFTWGELTKQGGDCTYENPTEDGSLTQY